MPGEKPFCMLCSIISLSFRKLYILFRKHDVNIFNGIDSDVIGLKFAGSDLPPFYEAKL